MKKWQQIILEKNDPEKLKKMLKELRTSAKMGKLTDQGKKRLAQIEDLLAQMGIFD